MQGQYPFDDHIQDERPIHDRASSIPHIADPDDVDELARSRAIERAIANRYGHDQPRDDR